MKFKTVAVVTAVAAFMLGAVNLFAGEFAVGRWQILSSTEKRHPSTRERK